MEHTPKIRQPLFRMGIIMLTLSFVLYLLPDLLPSLEAADGMGLFFMHYALLVLYFFSVLFSGRYKHGRGGLPLVIITLLLFLISAYALNRNMDVFHESAPWMQGMLVLSGVTLLISSLGYTFPVPVKIIQTIILSASVVFYTYLSIYLIPIYAFGLLGTIAVGIGLHAFVPFLLAIYTLKILYTLIQELPALKRVTWTTASVCLLFVAGYSYRWAQVQKVMESAFHSATLPDKTGWPAWVEALQKMPDGSVANKVLRSEIVYTVPNFDDGFDFFEAPRIRWEESKKHDPLVVLASLFSGKISIPQEDRIRMLQTIHDDRYGAEERLWSGTDLETVHMNTEVQIWPAMHLAYAEKSVTVANKAPENTWRGRQQEAIYIFQLPEGSVVTSLSLWIDGREEKSILTTKGKAVEAYTTIVGREARDPSVVHWQEGNRVSVRVFPVLANEQRIFKIGVTIPMPEREEKIWFENFTFTGPSAEKATEKVRVRLMQSTDEMVHTVALKRQQENTYHYDGKYNPHLSLALPATPLTPHAFVFEGKAFRMEAYSPLSESKQFTKIYADINAGWTNEDWKQLRNAAKGKKLRVYDEGWIEVDDLNAADVFERLRQQKLSLFPFYEISDTVNSLVVTKAAGRTPTIADIRESTGYDVLVKAATKGKRYHVYHIGEQPSLYISSLRELRLFHYAQGSLQKLVENLNRQVFEADVESPAKIVIHNAGMLIEASADISVNNAPDHLLRLFAYNHIMQQGGLRLLADSSLESSPLGEIASYAHIVSPVSSMIVLEKQEDYERFDINTNQEGLKNASAQKNGSVPEPHEWAIIIVALLSLFYYRYHQKINFVWLRK